MGTQLPQQGHSPPIFGPCLLWPNGWMDQDATRYRGRSRLRRHCVSNEPSSPQTGGTAAPPPHFSAHVLFCGQTAGWMKMPLGMKVGLGPGHIVLDGDPRTPSPKGAQPQPSNFRPISVVAIRLDGSRCHLVRRSASAQPICEMGIQLPTPKRGTAAPFLAHVCCGQAIAHLSYTAEYYEY